MPDEIQTPPQVSFPPVIDSLERKSAKKPLIYTAVIIVLLVLVYGGWSFFKGGSTQNNQATNVKITPTQAADLPTNNSDSQLTKDVDSIDTQISTLEENLKEIDDGFNDQAVNLD